MPRPAAAPDAAFISQTFSKRLRELSDSRGTYSQIARDLGINRQQFARYLNGTSKPRDALVRKMAQYFDVDPGTFFQSSPYRATEAGLTSSDPSFAAAVLGGLLPKEQTVVSEQELASGLYMQYKQSFTRPDQLILLLTRISRTPQGNVQTKMRYSTKVISALPGVRPSHVTYGTIVKNLGAFVLMETNGVAGDLVFSSFRPSSLYYLADRVLTGVTMTHGRPGNLGPVAGRHVLERLPERDAPLAWARKQGFHPLSEQPEYIQYHFQQPDHVPGGVMAVR